MKPYTLHLLLLMPAAYFSFSFIQQKPFYIQPSPKDSTIFNCSLDIRNPVFTIDSLTGGKAIVYGKTNPSFSDVEYFADCNGFINTYCRADTSVLFYNVYYPKNHNYDSCALPAIIMFHGGGFSDCKPIDTAIDIRYICNELARRGFVVFNINYRTGSMYDFVEPAYTSAQQVLAFYRAVQDGRGAVRSIIKRSRQEHIFHDAYKIDTSNIFLAGASAGSAIALNIAYCQSQAMIDSVSPGVKNVLGSINQDFYYGDTTIQYQKKIKGVMNMWGNMFIPLSAYPDPTKFFSKNINNPPVISFHGLLDSIAPYGITPIKFSPNNILHSIYNSETHCLVSGSRFRLYPKNNGPDMYSSGSQNIYSFLRQKNISAELYLDCQMGHGPDNTPDSSLFESDFGTGFTNADAVNLYMVQRTAVFFQAVVNEIAKNLITTKFTECENKRFGCDTKNNNNGCSNKDTCVPRQKKISLPVAMK